MFITFVGWNGWCSCISTATMGASLSENPATKSVLAYRSECGIIRLVSFACKALSKHSLEVINSIFYFTKLVQYTTFQLWSKNSSLNIANHKSTAKSSINWEARARVWGRMQNTSICEQDSVICLWKSGNNYLEHEWKVYPF